MKKAIIFSAQIIFMVAIAVLTISSQSCKEKTVEVKEAVEQPETPEYSFSVRKLKRRMATHML